MISVEPTTDETYIKSVFLNPTTYRDMSDDSCPADPATLMGVNIMAVPGFFLRALVDGVPCGVWWLIWRGDTVEAHTALTPECRGARAIKATKAAIQWVFANTNAAAITSYAWSDSPAVAWFCRAVGMTKTETKPWPATRQGKPVEISYYAIQRGGQV
jgi:Protein of unknown function (DUF2824)